MADLDEHRTLALKSPRVQCRAFTDPVLAPPTKQAQTTKNKHIIVLIVLILMFCLSDVNYSLKAWLVVKSSGVGL